MIITNIWKHQKCSSHHQPAIVTKPLIRFLLDLNRQLPRGRDHQQRGLAAGGAHPARQHVGEGREPRRGPREGRSQDNTGGTADFSWFFLGKIKKTWENVVEYMRLMIIYADLT